MHILFVLLFNTFIKLLVLGIHMITTVSDNKFVLNHETQNTEKLQQTIQSF